MRESSPSRTALRVAVWRAAHQFLDNPKVLDDPLAVAIVGSAIDAIRADPWRYKSRLAERFRAFMVARSRYAEDQLAISVAHGVEQYLVLGAGLDTSAYRGIATKGNVQIFEVDHPIPKVGRKSDCRRRMSRFPPVCVSYRWILSTKILRRNCRQRDFVRISPRLFRGLALCHT